MSTEPDVTYTEIRQGDKFGLTDEKGNVIVPCIWKGIGGFVEGLAPVEDETEMWGFIDTSGALVIPCRYDRVDHFSEGLAAVGTFSEERAAMDSCYIDRTGSCVLSNDSWENVSSFHDGLALVEVWKEDEGFYFAYIDKTGTEVITRPFDPPIEDNLDVDAIVDPETGRIRFGQDFYSDVRIIELNFSEQTLLRVKDVNGLFGFMDRFGKIVIPCIWRNAERFSGEEEGLAFVQNEHGLWGFINLSGQMETPFQWDYEDMWWLFGNKLL